MFLTPLRESHSARGNQRIYAPKGPLEAISPGGPLQAHRGGMRLTRRPLSRGWGAAVRALSLGLTPSGMRELHGWDHPFRASHAVNSLKDQTVGGVPSLTPRIITIPGRRPVPPRPRGFRAAPPPDHGEKQGAQGSNGNSAPRAALPPLAAGVIALPRRTLAMQPHARRETALDVVACGDLSSPRCLLSVAGALSRQGSLA